MNAITWTTRVAVVSAALVILSAGILGYTALFDLFVSIGLFASWLGVFFPLLFDLAEVAAAVSVFNAKLQGEDDRFAWGMVILFTILGIVANVSHATFAWWTGKIDSGQMTLAIFATSLFPLSVALVTHLVKRVIARDITRRTHLSTLAELTATCEHLRAHRDELETKAEELTGKIKGLQIEFDELRRTKVDAESSNIGQISPTVDDLNAVRLAKKEQAMAALLDYLSSNPHASLAEAGQAIGRSKTQVGNYVGELTTTGKLHRNGKGWEVSK